MSYTHIEPGVEIEVSTHIYHTADKDRMFELVKLPLHKLIELETASVKKEKEIFSKFGPIESEWAAQAGMTRALRDAQAYQKVLPVKHTSNKWEQKEYDWYEVSNMVYQMSYRIYEQTRYDRSIQKSVTVAWEISWGVYFNTIRQPDYTGSGLKIAGQSRKRFTDKASMEKYLQGRIAAYAHMFNEISPPIPKGEEGRFSVNGVLLPGYTVEVPERTAQEAAEELLSFLEADDIHETTSAEGETPPTEGTHDRSTPKKSAHSKKKGVPTR